MQGTGDFPGPYGRTNQCRAVLDTLQRRIAEPSPLPSFQEANGKDLREATFWPLALIALVRAGVACPLPATEAHAATNASKLAQQAKKPEAKKPEIKKQEVKKPAAKKPEARAAAQETCGGKTRA